MPSSAEKLACTPAPIDPSKFNPKATLPYGLTTAHVQAAMKEFIDFLAFMNGQLHHKGLLRLESMLMPASFSSMVGEFITTAIPKQCAKLVRNVFHNGYPDLIPAGKYAGDSVQYADVGIEVKGSRYNSGWQGHNQEDGWFMVVVFDSNRPVDLGTGVAPRPFKFRAVYLGELVKADWNPAPRGPNSRRTPTASIGGSGGRKLKTNWVYRD